jgi:heme-degrading monooxygenase HmoA
MFVRVVNFTGASNIDAGVDYIREQVTPVLREQHGFRGITVSADRAGGTLGVLSLWETAADRDASESVLAKSREEGQRIVGGELTLELFEQVVWEVLQPPAPGKSRLQIRRISMDPAKVEENIQFFKDVVLPDMKAQAGLQAVRNMINRQTGDGIVGSVWADEESLAAAAAGAEARRARAIERGVTFGEESRWEILFAELR